MKNGLCPYKLIEDLIIMIEKLNNKLIESEQHRIPKHLLPSYLAFLDEIRK